ncbi:hypothetical protein F7725_012538 [Dissostichus mawsoni]|uniref:Uncharacterized protein n=1 Tax=Dissostichus mawsoni TaxID=36200 RepID=A0A7J5YMN9_DISMA|nr:hypothetical protein F7725_012538 [Dissostichus mawsoni]
MIALIWPTDSVVPHQSNHDTAYLLQSPSNSLPDCFLNHAIPQPSTTRASSQPACFSLHHTCLPCSQSSLPTSTPDLHSLQTCLSLRTINHLNILSHCLRLGPV